MIKLQLLHAAATLFMTGLIWFVQLVHYPLMARVDRLQFAVFEQSHQTRTTVIVAPMMLLEMVTALWLLAAAPDLFTIGGAALLAIIWASTALLQVPAHRRLESGFDAHAHGRLVRTNWLRTLAWSLRSGLAMMLLMQ